MECTQELAEQAITGYERCGRRELQGVATLNTATDGLLRMVVEHRAAFDQVHGAKQISFMEHSLENMRIMGLAKTDIDPNNKGKVTAQFRDMTSYFNRREAQNARNLRWWIETAYAGRKVMIWAHNVHIMYSYFEPGFSAARMEANAGLMKSTGVYTAEWLGDKVYTIAFTAYEGREQTMRIFVPVPGHGETPAHQGNIALRDITRAFDAVFYVDQMSPATRIGAR